MTDHSKHVNQFWTEFSHALSKQGIDESRIKFYLQWARRYATWSKTPLRMRSLEDIRRFVAELRRSGVDDWQVNQAREAIAILYRDHLKFVFPDDTLKVMAGGAKRCGRICIGIVLPGLWRMRPTGRALPLR